MESSIYVCLLSILLFCHIIPFTHSFNSSFQPRCHDDESSALLQFKESFTIDNTIYDGCYPKVESWKLVKGERGDCCSWDGVQCDEETNHVISLNLANSCLYGSINSNNTLFRLVHLHSLNLACNDFNLSQIPSQIGRLSRLTHLNLSFSSLSGQIPQQIFNLSRLISLDLSRYYHGLKLHNPSFKDLVQHLTNLKVLHLSSMNISSKVPELLANFSSLEFLSLSGCGLQGEFPVDIFQLPNLKMLDLRHNRHLKVLDLQSNNLVGSVELSSFLQLKKLTFLTLSFNSLTLITKTSTNASTPDFLVLGLAFCNLTEFPRFLHNQDMLESLDLSSNNIKGEIPSWMCSISTNSLDYLNLSHNLLTGFEKDPAVLQWATIRILDLRNLEKLRILILRSNGFFGLIDRPQTKGFSNLRVIDLSHNNFTGKMPSTYFEMWDAMKVINASLMTYMEDSMWPHDWYNPFTNYGQYDYSMLMYNKGLELEYRKIPSILTAIDFSYNKFEGEIPDIIGNLQQLYLLNLSNNLLNGHIPSSLANLTELECLDLSRNMLSGKLPPELSKLTFLSSFNVSYNQLEGPIPRGNQFDTFESNQYEGNKGLCGAPLKKKCENFEASPQERSNVVEDNDTGSVFKLMIVLIGYGSGFIFVWLLGTKSPERNTIGL
ncbi:hypothetical protein GH714_030445 [Hevea brasiliensis]|uniref:Leucine-rich repeat-containing N-terminal plant-type domain-containing protein n=1 Tax=Hevea brasiliensis TaxID=3981 RepID=A0A6A6KBD3_HEVBR|nr:hypothetical protein GH714_030445 [Hevea brasiliensis]